MSRSVVALALALVSFGGVQTLAAQQPRRGIVEVGQDRTRQGFWLSAGLGAGKEQVDLANDGFGYSEPLWKPTFSLRLGGTPSQSLRLGAELFAWFNERGEALETLSSLQLVGQFYPIRTSGLHLRGGAGLARSAVEYDFFGDVANTGFAASFGAGIELELSRNIALVPAADMHYQWYDGSDGYTERILNLGVSIQFQASR